jgi:hypothetical protein
VTDVWVANDDGTEIVRTRDIAAANLDYNGNVKVRLAGPDGAVVTLVAHRAHHEEHRPGDLHRMFGRPGWPLASTGRTGNAPARAAGRPRPLPREPASSVPNRPLTVLLPGDRKCRPTLGRTGLPAGNRGGPEVARERSVRAMVFTGPWL